MPTPYHHVARDSVERLAAPGGGIFYALKKTRLGHNLNDWAIRAGYKF